MRQATEENAPYSETVRMRLGPDHVRAAQLRRGHSNANMPAGTQRAWAGTGRLNDDTDFWGGDDTLLHFIMSRAWAQQSR